MTPAGWFPDPLRRFEYRYFDGQHWTANVSSHGAASVDPLGVAPTPAGAPSPTPAHTGRGAAIAGLILGLVAVFTAWVPFLVVVGLVAAVLAIVFGVMSRRAAPAGQRTTAGTVGLILGIVAIPLVIVGAVLTTVVWREVSAFIDPGLHTLTVDGPCTVDDGVLTFTGTIENLTDSRRGYTVDVRIRVDGGSERIRQVSVDPVAPGATAPWQLTSLVDGTEAECRVDEVFGPFPFGLPVEG